MKAVIQRVNKVNLKINGALHASIAEGLLVLLGIEESDFEEDIKWLAEKITKMRIFADHEGKMNVSLIENGGEIMLVSQFTLYASTKKGNRPSFTKSANPIIAKPLYNSFIKYLNALLNTEVKTGVFGADMQIELVNDGPVTIIIDSKNRE